jgi:hypothetical protein
MKVKVVETPSFNLTKLTPKALFLTAAFASFLLSIALWFSGDRQAGIFVGIWVPSICAAGALILAGGRHE